MQLVNETEDSPL